MLILSFAGGVSAANKYWSGTGTWTAGGANWGTVSGGPYASVFNTGDAAIFEGTAGTVTVSAPNNPLSLAFNVAGYTLDDGTITMNGPGITATQSATITSILAGTAGLTKSGASTLTLTGMNAYTGTTTLNSSSGTLEIAGAGSLAGGAYANNLVIGTSSTFKYNSSTAQLLSGVVSGAGTLLKDNGSTLTLTGVNTHSGPITLSANTGTVEIGGAGSLRSGAYSGAIAIGAGATFKFNSSAIQTLSGVISGAGTVVKDNSGVLTLSGSNTFTGALTVTAGTLKKGSSAAIANTVDVIVNGTLDMNATSETIGTLSGSGIVDNLAGVATYTLTTGNSANTVF